MSQFNEYFTKEHWIAAKRILRYLKGTSDYTLKYTKTNEKIIGYADADWGSCINDRRSYTGYTFIMSGAPISWKARKQRTVALSSMSLTEASKEAIYLQNLLKEINFDCKRIKLFCDNFGAGMLAKHSIMHSRSKHIDIKHHFIREVVEAGKVEIEYLPTELMTADVMTKSLTAIKHRLCVKAMNLSTNNVNDDIED